METPILIVQGSPWVTGCLVRWAALGCGPVAVGAALRNAPQSLGPFLAWSWSAPILLFAWIVGFLAVEGFLRRHIGARTGRVEFYAEFVLLQGRLILPEAYDWKDVRGFDDGSSDYVTLLLRRDARLPTDVDVPTPTEKDRVAVLDLLVRRGIPREGA